MLKGLDLGLGKLVPSVHGKKMQNCWMGKARVRVKYEQQPYCFNNNHRLFQQKFCPECTQ
jgi:hypothetical protein